MVGEASDGRESVALAEALKPDVAVLDITMPNMNGIEAARQIGARQPGVAIVVLSMHSDEGYVLRALKAGARGYLLKESPAAHQFVPEVPAGIPSHTGGAVVTRRAVPVSRTPGRYANVAFKD